VTSPAYATTARRKEEQPFDETRVTNVEARKVGARRAGVRGLAVIMGLLAVASLALTAASLLIIAGVLFALLLFFPLFVLGLVGVLAALQDHTVEQHSPTMDGTKWRNGS
jgi:hypothetical protein